MRFFSASPPGSQPPSDPIRLSQLPVGTSAVVRPGPADPGGVLLRLRELGLLPGVRLTLLRTAPLGDPLEIRVRGSLLSLRKSEADHVCVQPS
jgi:ferrous iron transport protein A